MSFQDALMFLQNLPTKAWEEDEIKILLAKSYEMKQMYHYNMHLINQKMEEKQIENDLNQ